MLRLALTPRAHAGSLRFAFLLAFFALATPKATEAGPRTPLNHHNHKAPVKGSPEKALAVADRGIFSDLDDKVQLELPANLERAELSLLVDPRRRLLTLYRGEQPLKVYPLGGDTRLTGKNALEHLRRGDRSELSALAPRSIALLARGDAPPPGDADGDGIADPLDLLIGAHKTALNGAAYGAGYMRIAYPGGDVPRDVGVCTDVIIRAVRNVGVDLQAELQRDIRRSRRSYPMVRVKNPHINHRRVKTLLPYFKRHWDLRERELKSSADPLLPGDVVFMDTFPHKKGPDHIGIVSDQIGASGHPLIINNWTDGTHTEAMDLLEWVPVTHRFRIRSLAKR